MLKQRNDLFLQNTGIEKLDDFPATCFRYVQAERNLSTLHYHDCFEIGLCLEGSGMYSVENRLLSFQTGTVTLMYPSCPHIAQSPKELPSRWLYIHADLDRLLDSTTMGRMWEHHHRISKIVPPDKSRHLQELIHMIAGELEAKGENHREIARALLYACVQFTLRLREDSDVPMREPGDSLVVAPALMYITKNYAQPTTLHDLAKECGFSDTHFRAVFHQALGTSPMQYLTAFRMRMTKTLLKATSLPIVAISESVGYATLSSFNRAFKAETGISPSAYRKQKR